MGQALKRRGNFLVRGVCNTILLNTIYKKEFDITKTLVVAGTTRSGSTWLAEIVSASPGCGQIFEPLSPTHVNAARKAGVTHNTFMAPSAEWPAGKGLLQQVLSGQLLTPWTTSQIPISKAKEVSCLVVKFVRANMLLGWLSANFPIKPPALIVRHPCAIIASQTKKRWMPGLRLLLENPFFHNHPELKERCMSLSRPEEIRALHWCMRYHAPLSLPGSYPFVLLSYEGLVRHGGEELERLYRRWELPLPTEALAMLRRPSKTVTGESQVVLGKDPLAGWKKHLTKEESAIILKVVAMFGLDFYSEEIEPDYARLQQTSGIISF